MFTSAECRAHAEQKLEQAEHDQQHRRRLITAAEAWLNLASQIETNRGKAIPAQDDDKKGIGRRRRQAPPAELHDL